VSSDRHIGRKAIINFLRPLLGCTSWYAIRYHVTNNKMPVKRLAKNGKPYVTEKDIHEWLREKK